MFTFMVTYTLGAGQQTAATMTIDAVSAADAVRACMAAHPMCNVLGVQTNQGCWECKNSATDEKGLSVSSQFSEHMRDAFANDMCDGVPCSCKY